MENQVGSINFDANALYLEEEDEHEDDKQQDNEIKALISQGGLDGILDDDSMLSSSADSSYDDSDSEQNHKQNQNFNPHHLNMQQHHQNFQNQHQEEENEDENDLSIHPNNFKTPAIINSNINATPAHVLKQNHLQNQNYLLNHYSTPSNQQNPPPPQMLQATIIPTIQEEKLFYRQRNNHHQQQQQQPIQLQNNNNNNNTVAQINEQEEENLIENMTQNNNNNNNNNNQDMFMNLQKQHYVSHSKLHSLERFSAPKNLINNEEQNENDHLNGFRNTTETNTNKIPIASFGNGVQLEYTNEKNINQNHEIIQTQTLQQNNKFPETSIIDLNELDEEQLKELHDEEEKQQQEYFSIDHLNRLYCQAQFLYKIRGKKLEEVTNRFAAYQEDMSREIRAMKHRLYLAEKEKESVQVSLDQAHDLCNQYKAETDTAKKTCADAQEKFEKLKQTNRILEQQLSEHEHEIENLHLQISEQQKLDTLERLQEQHEHFIQQLRDQYEKDLFQMKEKMSDNQKELNEKHEFIRILKVELDNATKNSEKNALERADIVNRLTKSLNDLQNKYNQDIIMVNMNNNNKLNDDNKTKLIEQLSEKCRELEHELKQTVQKASQQTLSGQTNDSFDFHISNLSNTLNVLSTNESVSTGSMKSLQNELERALNLIKQKRIEIQTYQIEIDKLKSELANCRSMQPIGPNEPSSLKLEIERLNHLIDELQREKIDLTNDLNEKNTKLDQLLDSEEHNQQIKSNLELELYNKQENIQELEKIIDQLHQELNQQAISNNLNQLNEQFKLEKQNYEHLINEYEAQVGELKLKLANREHELQRCREMYIEVCNDKNNLQDTLKLQYDQDYEQRLKQKLDSALSSKLEEQKSQLNEKWSQERSTLVNEYRKQIENNLADLKSTREQIIQVEKKYDQLRLDKANLELKSNRTETDLRDKCFNLEKQSKELEDKLFSEIKELKQKIEKLNTEKEELIKKQSELSDKLVCETEKSSDLNKQLSETNQKLKTNSLDLDKSKQNEILIKNLELKLETETEKYKKEIDNLNMLKSKELNDEINKYNQLKLKLETEIDRLKNLNTQLSEKLETSKQNWNNDKINLLSKKDEELQKVILQLEKRFEEDYSKFMQTHKEAMHRALNEKTQEHSKEREKLIDMYQKKISDYETNEQNLLKQIKEIKALSTKIAKTVDSKTQTDSVEIQSEQDLNLNNEYINNLLDKIKSLEEMISKTDAHFESELNKIRDELEEEYHLKLKEELEKYNENNQDLIHERPSSDMSEEYDDLSLNESKIKIKYSKLKQDLNIKEKEFESVEQTYRLKLEQLQEKFQDHLSKMQQKYDSDLKHVKQDLSENYKQALNKSKSEIDQMQSFVQKLKKANLDSDKLIESLKLEMKKIKENHLDELTMLKINSEREKETLKESYEQSVKKLSLLEKQLDESDERLKKHLELLRAELKTEYGIELSKMNSKMKDMMKSHASAIDLLKKQHQQQTSSKISTGPISNSKSLSCQTDTTYKDIDLLETFRQKYLETLSRMKTDMMKEFDAQTLRVSERVTRQINQERGLIKEKIQAIFIPKISDLLKEFRVSETMIRIKIEELENDLDQIILGIDPKKPLNKIEENLNNQNITAKRSASSITSSTSKLNDHANLHSKSASSMRDIQPTNAFKIDLKENDLKQVETEKASKQINGSITLSSGYKYTPLRQSWSNLSQMNTLSPYSSSNFESPLNKKLINEEEILAENLKIMQTSPVSTNTRLITNHKKEIELSEEEKINPDEDKNYIYVDDNQNSDEEQPKNSYFKKYRTQNIRQKKTQKNLIPSSFNSNKIPPQRPHSASNLLRSTSNFIPNQSNGIKQSEKAQILTRSNTNVSESITRRQDIMKPKTNLSIKNSLSRQSLSENDHDDPPTRLSDSDDLISESSKVSSKASAPTLRSASSVINTSTRSGSSLGLKTTNNSNASAFSSNSLPRSRTPNGSSINSDLMASSHSYRSATLSSINKSSQSSNENIHMSSLSTLSTNINFNNQSTTSTQYHSISSNLIKNSAFQYPQQSKKKSFFY